LSDEWVFSNPPRTGNAELKDEIAAMFEAVGLANVRGRALWWTFDSIAADEGCSDATIGELLGHARLSGAQRHYMRWADAALVAL
jgi:hypothetical protein